MKNSIESSAVSHAVIFVHGFLDAAAIWDGVVDRLEGTGLLTSAVDLPGMGALATDDTLPTLERYAELVSAKIQGSELPVILVGQSMGAQVVELAAAINPDKVVGLVLVTPVPLGGVHAPAEMIAPFRKLGGDPAGQRQVRMNLSPALSSAQLDMLVGFGADVLPATVERLVDLWNEGHGSGEEASGFAGPVAIVRGGADAFVTAEMASAVAGRFRSPTEVASVDGGHWLHVEQPEAVAGAIVGMIAVLRGGGDWQQAFAKRSAGAFAQAFAEDVQLEASVMYSPVKGRENVKVVMEAASKIYEGLEFVAQTTHENSQYLQWKARAFGGMEMEGVTVITRNSDNAIQRVAIHHRPLTAALLFSVTIGERLRDLVDSSHFLAAADLPSHLRSL